MWREDLILERATKAAKKRVAEKSIRQSLREWESVSPLLFCSLCEKTPSSLNCSGETPPPQWFVKENTCTLPTEDGETLPAAILCPPCMFGTWTIYSPVQTEIVQQAKFDRTGSTYNSLWKRVGDKKTIEQVNLLMNDVSYIKHQRPQDPDRLKSHLKRKGINVPDEDNKENNHSKPPPPVTGNKIPKTYPP